MEVVKYEKSLLGKKSPIHTDGHQEALYTSKLPIIGNFIAETAALLCMAAASCVIYCDFTG
jgi:hypothetical protein